MPNGTELSALAYRERQVLFEPIDAVVTQFAAEVGARLFREYHGYPCRSIVSNGDIVREIGISVLTPRGTREKRKFLVGYSARKTVGALSYTWPGRSITLARLPDAQKFYELLRRLWRRLESLTSEDLKLTQKQRHLSIR